MSLDDFRAISAITGIVAFSLGMWRTVGLWDRMTLATKVTGVLLASLTLICALGTARAAQLDAPFNELSSLVFVHYLASITVSVFGPRTLNWLKTRKSDVTSS